MKETKKIKMLILDDSEDRMEKFSAGIERMI
jgi:hypothetical protein